MTPSDGWQLQYHSSLCDRIECDLEDGRAHEGAVTSLATGTYDDESDESSYAVQNRTFIASGSEDHSVKIWAAPSSGHLDLYAKPLLRMKNLHSFGICPGPQGTFKRPQRFP